MDWFSANEPAVFSLFTLIVAAWFYYLDVYLHKLEFRRSRARFFLVGSLISYPLLLVTFPYIDSFKAYWASDKFSIVVIALLALAAAGIGMVTVHRSERSKREEVAQVARRLNCSYDPDGKIPLPADLLKVPTFDSVGKGVTHILRGHSLDHEYAIFEHRYAVGDDTTHHTIAAYRTSCPIPAFELRPEHLLDKLVAACGGIDVDFPEHPTFSSAYRLLCEDEDQAVIRRMFAGRLCSLFEREQGWTVGAQGHWVGLYKHRGLREPEELQSFYETTKGMAKAIESAARSVGHSLCVATVLAVFAGCVSPQENGDAGRSASVNDRVNDASTETNAGIETKVGIIDVMEVLKRTAIGQPALAKWKREADEATRRKDQYMAQYFQARQYHQRWEDPWRIARRNALNSLVPLIETAAKAVAEKHGFGIVIAKGDPETLMTTFYASGAVDLTDEVIEELNRRHP